MTFIQKITCGVLQGSILDHLLILLRTNNFLKLLTLPHQYYLQMIAISFPQRKTKRQYLRK